MGIAISRSKSFIVIIHDAAEPFAASLITLLQALNPLVQQTVAAAVVPCWHSRISVQPGTVLHTYLREQCGEILLHGYTHRCLYPRHPLALLTDNANEFSGLSRIAAYTRLKLGKMILSHYFDTPIQGFVPPAWQYGPLDRHLLRAAGLTYGMRFLRLEPVRGKAQPLATWSWDTGRIAALGLPAHIAGHAQWLAGPDRLPCIVLHPADVQRGFLAWALRLVQKLLDKGYQPVLPGDLW